MSNRHESDQYSLNGPCATTSAVILHGTNLAAKATLCTDAATTSGPPGYPNRPDQTLTTPASRVRRLADHVAV